MDDRGSRIESRHPFMIQDVRHPKSLSLSPVAFEGAWTLVPVHVVLAGRRGFRFCRGAHCFEADL